MKNFIKKAYPFIYGIFGNLGFICFIDIFLDFDYKISEHPYSYPFCLIAGSISLIICIVVFCLDITAFIEEEQKLHRLLYEIDLTIASFTGSCIMWLILWETVSEFIQHKGW